MIASPQIIESARQRGERFPQFVPSLGRSIRSDKVVDLLAASTSPAAQRGARQVLRAMAATPWRVVAAVHTNRHDMTRHITIEVGRTRYHLRLDARGSIFDITTVLGEEIQRVSGNRPWVRPGSI